MPYLQQRKYTDLIHQASSKWVNWDPSIPVKVGSYGEIELTTGELQVKGNIYDTEFQDELDKLDPPIRMADHPPQETGVEDDHIIASKGAKRVQLSLGPEANIAGLATASIKGQWQFERGKRDALLIMHCPRIKYLPSDGILEKLFKVPKLKDMWLVTNVHICPAFSMYLSNKSGEKVALALLGQVPVPAASGITAGGDVEWWLNPVDFLRKGCDKTGKYCYSPLYTMKRQIRRSSWFSRRFREGKSEEVKGDDLWEDTEVPWGPLDEEGEEDALDMGNSPIEG